ncbi:MAG: hypothetical protein U1U88_002140 [Lawsonella clevelandensis]
MCASSHKWKALSIGASGAAAGIASFMTVFSQLTGKATEAENTWTYPGDDLIDRNYTNGRSSTYAIDIDAPAYAVYRILEDKSAPTKADPTALNSSNEPSPRLPFFNSYEIQEEWQQPDSLMPGDVATFDFTA